jgi:hypothetical protein
MIVWMLYCTFVALCVTVAAHAAEWLARLAGFRVRWIWTSALALVLLLSASPLLRRSEPVSPSVALRQAEDILDAPWLRTITTVRDVVSPTADGYAVTLSVLFSLALILVLAGVSRRFRRATREWPLVMLHGTEVRLAPRLGPLVIGLTRPEIVVPRWLLARPAEQQRLVVTHEAEHVRAGDHFLLAFGWSALVVAPWNPALWYMLSRLRLAVELDCDARVIRRGALPRSYGSLLIDMARHASALRLSALALADDASHLRQRILAMTPSTPRFHRLRAGFAIAITLAGLIVACRASIPSDPEIPPVAVQTAGSEVPLTSATVVVEPNLSSVRPLTRLKLRPAPAQVEQAVSYAIQPDSSAKPSPILFLDGKRVTMREVLAMDRSLIGSIEVLKGPAADQYVTDGARLGVVVITTKRAP